MLRPKDISVPEQVVKPEYESGMKIAYDDTSRRVVVSFRGRIVVMPESYPTQEEGIAVGERYCRSNGWIPSKRKTVRRPW